MSKKERQIKYEGELNLNGLLIPCYVLDDGTRVLSGRAMQSSLKMVDDAVDGKQTAGTRLARFLSQKSLKPFIFKGKEGDHFEPIICYKGDAKVNGYEATILADICDGFLEARKHIALSARQQIIADQAEILIRAFARVGIIALVDEATGYQHERERDALQKILSAYIAPELLPWQQRFPDEFYQEIFRLRGWDYTVKGIGIKHRPGVIGKWTRDMVYAKLPEGVLRALYKNTPRTASGKLAKKLHQSLTVDIGNPHLEKLLVSIITLMNVSKDWREFLKLYNKKFGQQELEFPEAEIIQEPSQPKTDFDKQLKGLLSVPKPKD